MTFDPEGRGVVTFDPGQGGGVLTFDHEGCAMTFDPGGVVTFDPGWGGWLPFGTAYLSPVGQTDACENKTFARFATRVVIIILEHNTF